MSGMDVLAFLNVTCAECQDLGPPPDSILAIPPPPLPAFLQPFVVPDNHTPSCGTICSWSAGHPGEFVEVIIPEVADHSDTLETPSETQMGASIDKSLMLFIANSCVVVLMLISLLAVVLFLIKTKRYRNSKVALPLEPVVRGCEVLYPGSVGDSKALWATLTPRGPATTLAPTNTPGTSTSARTFENSGFIDPDDYLRLRPSISSPTRIEHPNLPPLNLRTLRRESSDTAPIV